MSVMFKQTDKSLNLDFPSNLKDSHDNGGI